MHLTHKLQPRASFALIYVFAGACVFFTIVRLVLVFAQGPEFARTFLFDMSYSSNGAGFERRLFWTGLSGVPLFALALVAPSLDGWRFCRAFAACAALSVLTAIFYASMHFPWIEASGIVSRVSYDFRFIVLNYWPTSLSIVCYAHIGIDRTIRCLLSRRAK